MNKPTLCEKLVGKIAEKFTLQTQQRDNASSTGTLPAADDAPNPDASLERELSDLTDHLLYDPLCLLPLPADDRPVAMFVRQTASLLFDSSVPVEQLPSIENVAQTDIEKALKVLRLDAGAGLLDKGTMLLLAAAVLAKQEDFPHARDAVEVALPYFSPQDGLHRVVAYLMLGNFYYFSGQGSQESLEALAAYSQAIRHLSRLSQTEAHYGRKYRAEMYRLLKDRLALRLADRNWTDASDADMGKYRLVE